MDKKIAIITARGGSKRIPKKNIKDFCGKPIIAYSINAALEADIFDEVMVSTDSIEIAEIAKKYGAQVPFMRSKKNSDDFATTEEVILEVIEEYGKRGVFAEYICCLYPTAPFVTSDVICNAMKIMEEKNPSIVIPVVPFSYPPQRCLVLGADGYSEFKYPEYATTRSQDLEKWYHDVGQFYVYNTKKLVQSKGVIVDDMIQLVISEMNAQDIDTIEDWKIAEMKYKMIKKMDGEK